MDTIAFDAVTRDIQHGLRRLRRDWPFAMAAVLILALGIGANTALFSLVNAILFRHASLPRPDRLVDIYQRAGAGGQDASSYPAYLDIATHSDVFVNTTAASVPHGATYQHENALRSATVENTTATYLSVLGLRPALGRWFTAAEDTHRAPVVAVIGHHLWTQRFGADPLVIGRTIRIDGVPVTIVGVGPRGHNGTINTGIHTDFWLPVTSLPAFGMAEMLKRRPNEAVFLVKARLADGVTVAQAQAAMDILGRRLADEYPDEDPGRGIRVVASDDIWIHPQLDPVIAAAASAVLAIVGLVLAIACSNLATMLLVRGAARAKEIAIRLAVGATRKQLVRQLVTESLLLSLAGGMTGCIVAWWAIQWLRTIELPFTIDLALDTRVLAYAILVSMVTGIACGLAPALNATKVDLLPVLHSDAGGRTFGRLTLKNALIVFQVSMSVLLLGGANIFRQWTEAERTRPLGYAVDGVAMVEIDSRFTGYTEPQASSMYDELLRRTAAIPGVESAALARGRPMEIMEHRIVVERNTGGTGSSGIRAVMISAGPQFLETMRVPIVHGRTFDERDRANTPRVAVISETMAFAYFGGAVNALGRRFRMESEPGSWMAVIGVTSDVGTDLVDPHPHQFYLSFRQSHALPTTIVARTSGDAANLVSAMQRTVRDVDATIPVTAAKTMAHVQEEARVGSKAISVALAVLGTLGVLLASVGLYAVISFAVARQSREIGIRLALGARSESVVWRVTRGVAALVGIGTALGLMLSIAATLALRAAYAPAPGVSLYRPSIDPLALLAIAGIIGVVGVAAAFAPARRAALTDPLVALRRD